jgi:hypothetical protein
MSSRKSGKSSKIDPPSPLLPAVSWDWSEQQKPNDVLASEPNFHIFAVSGRRWDNRSVEKPGGGQMAAPVARRKQWKP